MWERTSTQGKRGSNQTRAKKGAERKKRGDIKQRGLTTCDRVSRRRGGRHGLAKGDLEITVNRKKKGQEGFEGEKERRQESWTTVQQNQELGIGNN